MEHKKKKQNIVIDDKHDFMPVICNHVKKNDRICDTYLGDIEISRPNISKHRCRNCKIVYRHIVSEDGMVTCEITDDVVLATKMVAKVIVDARRH